ncbi:hypothetical protein Cni_G06581 [Canna indica]|uniref:Myb-like domain-containing protein n=1 Tax=Canna indica TaxID=4628 RepID=A0AAQ3JYT0_9LILI|nr:hypothetical protein Cni_G06581 [Canna indica]
MTREEPPFASPLPTPMAPSPEALIPPPISPDASTHIPSPPEVAIPPPDKFTPHPPSPKVVAAAAPLPPSTEVATPLPPSTEVAPPSDSSPGAFSLPAMSSSTSLAWSWVIESLVDCKQVDVRDLEALIHSYPDFKTSAPRSLRERVALRILEELVGMGRGEGPSDLASTIGIDVSQSCEEVLGKFCQEARLFNLEKDSVNLLTPDLQEFIVEKRNSLPKSSLDKIKEAIVQGNCPALLSLFEDFGFPVQREGVYPRCNIDNATSQRVDNPTALAPGNCIGPEQENDPRSNQQFLKQNVFGLATLLKRGDLNNGVNEERIDGFTETERSKGTKLSTEQYHLQSINKDFSESMNHLFKKNDEYAETVSTRALDLQANQQGSMHEESDQENIKAGNFQIQQSLHANGNIIVQNDASGDGQYLPNALNEKDPLNVQISVTPDMVGDVDDLCDMPSNADTDVDTFASEKHCHLSCQANINNHYAIEDCIERGLCIKCNKGGEMLTCNSTDCVICIHETCLASSPKFNTSSLFFCPFCTFARAAVEYRKAMQNFFQASKFLSAFTGRDCVLDHQSKWSSFCDVTEGIAMRNDPCGEQNAHSCQFTRDKLNKSLKVDNEQTHQLEVAQSGDVCKSPFREGQALGNERIFHTSHCLVEVNDGKVVNEVLSATHCSNADPTNEEIVSHNNGEQVGIVEHQQLVEHCRYVHLACKEDSCHAKDGHNVVQGDNENPPIEQFMYEKEEDHSPIINESSSKESSSEKNENKQEQDEVVLHNLGGNKFSLGKPRRSKFRTKRYSNSIIPGLRRNNLPWTVEEEDFLKEAVHRFGEKSNGHIPWVNILEYGSHVFHRTRQPVDLKDKWRNIKKKEAPSTTKAP